MQKSEGKVASPGSLMADSNNMIAQMTLTGHIAAVWSDARAALAEMPRASRWFHIFWLLGPLILLIERSPADAWLTICAVTFAARAVLRREGNWLKVFWVRAVFAFWGVCLLSAALSEMPTYSLGEAFIWIRFPLFAMATCFWLATDKRLLFAMIGMTVLGMSLMTGILIAEVLIVGHNTGRLSWPYGDLVPGYYLSKACLPVLCLLVSLYVKEKLPNSAWIALVLTFVVSATLLTGERINALIVVCASILSFLVSKPKIQKLIASVFSLVFPLLLLAYMTPQILYRFGSNFFTELPFDGQSAYLRVWRGALELYWSSPFIGIGPDNYRNLCVESGVGLSKIDCHTHPHQFYLQILVETGLLGLVLGSIMIFAIIAKSFTLFSKNLDDVILRVAFIPSLAVFFPLQSTADFFGQWHNVFMWTGLALTLSFPNVLRESPNEIRDEVT